MHRRNLSAAGGGGELFSDLPPPRPGFGCRHLPWMEGQGGLTHRENGYVAAWYGVPLADAHCT